MYLPVWPKVKIPRWDTNGGCRANGSISPVLSFLSRYTCRVKHLPGKPVVLYDLVRPGTDDAVARVEKLDGWWAKGVGVLGRSHLAPGTGVWLPGVSSVHTLFVRMPLDLVFLDRELRLVRVRLAVVPFIPLVWCPGAHHTIELSAGTIKRSDLLNLGERWTLRDASETQA